MRTIRYVDSHGTIQFGSITPDGSTVRLEGDLYAGQRETGDPADVQKLMAPVRPVAIIGIGLNYRRHAKESGMGLPEYPVVFMKTPGAVQNPGDPIVLPRHLASTEVDYECELAVVIGKTCKNVARSEAMDVVLGFTCANDVSARDWQIGRGGSQWSRGKTFDTFAPLGPCLVTVDEFDDPNDLAIRTILNGEAVQDWRTGDMVFDVATLIEFLSGSTTLEAGTVILTGTPHGVGMAMVPPRYLKAGDEVVVEIEGIGRLENSVEEEEV